MMKKHRYLDFLFKSVWLSLWSPADGRGPAAPGATHGLAREKQRWKSPVFSKKAGLRKTLNRAACGSILIALFLLGPQSASATDYYWNVSSGDWGLADNWNLNSQNGNQSTNTPTNSDDVYINNGTANIGTGMTGTVNSLRVGASGTGALNISDGGKVTSARGISIGSSDGTVTVAGSGSELNGGFLTVGSSGTGVLNISDGGKVTSASNISVGLTNVLGRGSGTVTVAGSGSELKGNDLIVGDSGTGVLNISGGGKVTTSGSYIHIGSTSSGSGTVVVAGSGSELKGFGHLVVGFSGTGVLNISGGGKVTAYGVAANFIGEKSGSNGTVTVTGSGSELNVNSLFVGYSGTGVLNISDGGKASGGRIEIGCYSGASGTVTVGAGSTMESAYGVYVGGSFLAAGGTGLLAGSGTVSANNGTETVLVYNTGTLSPGDIAGESGTLNITGNLELDGATMDIDIASASSYDKIAVTGAVSGANNIVNAQSAAATGTFDILTATSGVVLTNFTLAAATNIGSLDGYHSSRSQAELLSPDAQTLQLILSNANKTLTWTGSASGNWHNTGTGDENWTDDPTGVNEQETRFMDGDRVSFGNAGSGQTTVDLASTLLVADMTVTDRQTYTFTGTGGISSGTSGKLVVNGGSKAAFSNSGTNNFVDGTQIDSGATVQIGSNGNLGGDIENNGTLEIVRSGAYTLDNKISGSGTTKMLGAGTLTIGGDGDSQSNAFHQTAGIVNLTKRWKGNYTQAGGILTGDGTIEGIFVSAKDLRPGNETTLGTLNVNGDADFSDATLRFKVDGTNSDKIEVGGDVTISAGGKTTTIDILNFTPGTYTLLTGGNDFFKNPNVFDASLLVGGSAMGARQTVSFDNTNQNEVKVTLSAGANTTLTWAGADGDSWRDSNKWRDATSALDTFLNGDKVVFNDLGTQTIGLGTSDVTVAEMMVTGGDYTFTGGTITATTDNTTLADATGKLVKKGGGTVTFNNANLFTNGTDLEGGRIVLANDSALGTQQIRMDAGTSLAFSGDRTISNSIQLKGDVTFDTGSGQTTLNGIITEDAGNFGFTKDGTGTLTLTGANTFTGSILVSEGTLTGTTSSIQGDVLLDGPETTFIFDQNINGTWVGNLSSNAATANVIKRGTGALTVSGDGSNFSGSTTIEAGTLVLQSANAVGTGTEIVNNATLRADFDGTLSNVLKGAGTLVIDKAVTLNRENADFTGEIKVNPSNSLTLDYATAVDLKNLLSGSGSVTKTGIGKLTLSGVNTNTNTGTFTQSTGDVHLASNWAGDYTQNAGTTFTSADGATISGDADFSGTVTPTGTLTIGGDGTFSGATLNLGALNPAAVASASTITVGGTASFTNTTVMVDASSISSAGTYTLI
ncbi:autotransporter-associated beta strand repeat-containing protein, partial [Desulfosarcina sp. OttesenSCG-928-A07]|nr:autotransporter-associated beta strand repeat-containing protein [Desulfosarcina sp. OttesenSCG-928-A07]